MPLSDAVQFISGVVEDCKIPHVIIGGIAASAFGEPRATKDADLVILITPQFADQFLRIIEDHGLFIERRREVLRKLVDKRDIKMLRRQNTHLDWGYIQERVPELAKEAGKPEMLERLSIIMGERCP